MHKQINKLISKQASERVTYTILVLLFVPIPVGISTRHNIGVIVVREEISYMLSDDIKITNSFIYE